MPAYLLHKTGDGYPAGVYTESADYYDPQWEQLREEGREIVYSKLVHVPWGEFIERLASTYPSNTMSWDVYVDSAQALSEVLSHAQRDTQREGYPQPE